MGDFINYVIDNLISVTWRLLDLPLYAIVLIMGAIIAIINFMFRRLRRKLSPKFVLRFNVALITILVLLIIDKKFSNMRQELTFLNEKITKAQFGEVKSAARAKLYDLSEFKINHPDAEIRERSVNEGFDLISYAQDDPMAVVNIAVVDLKCPGLKVNITPELTHKFLTSSFAEQTNSELAVNGEAGLSMAMDCELGEWSGNWVVNGNAVSMIDTDLRPFLSFSKENKGTYFKASILDTVNGPEKYNTIWGRHDILVDGVVSVPHESKPYSRTVMGLDEKGEKLYLMIVDGKRPDYSIGLSYDDCAQVLKELGAYNAMACDQGGSSCMYVKSMGGIINRPADSEGIERPVYTHFAIGF